MLRKLDRHSGLVYRWVPAPASCEMIALQKRHYQAWKAQMTSSQWILGLEYFLPAADQNRAVAPPSPATPALQLHPCPSQWTAGDRGGRTPCTCTRASDASRASRDISLNSESCAWNNVLVRRFLRHSRVGLAMMQTPSKDLINS